MVASIFPMVFRLNQAEMYAQMISCLISGLGCWRSALEERPGYSFIINHSDLSHSDAEVLTLILSQPFIPGYFVLPDDAAWSQMPHLLLP